MTHSDIYEYALYFTIEASPLPLRVSIGGGCDLLTKSTEYKLHYDGSIRED